LHVKACKTKAKNLYRKDAKIAKKQNTSLTILRFVFLCGLCVLAVRMPLNGKER